MRYVLLRSGDWVCSHDGSLSRSDSLPGVAGGWKFIEGDFVCICVLVNVCLIMTVFLFQLSFQTLFYFQNLFFYNKPYPLSLIPTLSLIPFSYP